MGWVVVGTAVLGAPRFCIFLCKMLYFPGVGQKSGRPKNGRSYRHPSHPHLTPSENPWKRQRKHLFKQGNSLLKIYQGNPNKQVKEGQGVVCTQIMGNSLSFGASSVSSAKKNSVSSLWHTNNRLKGTHWALSPERGEAQKLHWV